MLRTFSDDDGSSGIAFAPQTNIPNIKIPTYIIPYGNILAMSFPCHLESL